MTPIHIDRRAFLAASALPFLGRAPAADEPAKKGWKFQFGTGKTEGGYMQVPPETVYAKERGYGFEPGAKVVGVDRGGADLLRAGFCTGDKPFHFSVAVPEGNYTITVILGDANGESTTTVKAELRRLMLEQVKTAKGKFETRTFAVNVRTPAIPKDGEVKLKDREKTAELRAWDDKLTLEFNGDRPCVCAIEIVPADVPTLFLLGDSTVCDQPGEPYASWGLMLPRFFTASVAVANHAQSGESIKSSLGARRVEKVLATLRKGDFVFLQFGHNDMKAVTPEAYQADLKRVVADVRAKGGTAVLVTPMHRRTFQGATVTNSLKGFPDAVRELAKAETVPLIDLHAMSATLYEALGSEKSRALFKAGDGTHHNNYGAYQLAKCVVAGIRQAKLGVAKYLTDDVPPFDPAKPDPVTEFKVPASPGPAVKPPDGK